MEKAGRNGSVGLQFDAPAFNGQTLPLIDLTALGTG